MLSEYVWPEFGPGCFLQIILFPSIMRILAVEYPLNVEFESPAESSITGLMRLESIYPSKEN